MRDTLQALQGLLAVLPWCKKCEANVATRVGDDGDEDDSFAICDDCDDGVMLWDDNEKYTAAIRAAVSAVNAAKRAAR